MKSSSVVAGGGPLSDVTTVLFFKSLSSPSRKLKGKGRKEGRQVENIKQKKTRILEQ